MAHPFLPPILLVFSPASSSFISNAEVAEAAWWHGWWHVFPGRYGRGCGHILSIVTEEVYAAMFLHKAAVTYPAKNFYNYSSFVRAAERFPKLGGPGPDLTTCKREVATFLAQISYETTDGWPTAPDEPYAWGLCFKEEQNPPSNYCHANNMDNKNYSCVMPFFTILPISILYCTYYQMRY